MANKKANQPIPPEETPKEKPELEELLQERDQLQAEEEKKVEEEARRAEEEAKIPEVEIDLDEEREKTKREVVESLEKEVIEPLKKEIIDLKKVMSPEEKDDYDKFVEDYTKEHGEAPQWKQVAFFLEERAVNRLKSEQESERKAQEEAETVAKQKQEETNNANFRYWQSQLDQMAESGMLPKMERSQEGDPGFDARVKLYALMANTWNKPGVEPVTNLYEAYTRFYGEDQRRPRNSQPAGFDAPTDMGGGSPMGDDEEKIDYAEIHQGGRDLDSFIQKQLKKLGIG